MKFLFSLFLLAVGFAMGFSAKYLVPDIIPTKIKIVEEKIVPVIGPVVSKELKKDSLLVTIDTDQGAMLATFKKKVSEINLLIDEGDTVELSPRRYEPFINDPKIRRVRKGRGGVQTSHAEPSTSYSLKTRLPSDVSQPVHSSETAAGDPAAQVDEGVE